MADDPAPLMHVQWLRLFEQWRQELKKPLTLNMEQIVAGVLGVAQGGTGISSYTIGDLLYASAATTLSKLADVSAGSYLRSGGVATAPLWSTLKLPNAATSGDILKASGANVYASASPQALTKTDDTNVTLTLGGSPTIALVNAASLTLGWTGTLSVARGGTGSSAGPATIAIADDTTTNATMFPTWVTANTGNLPLKVTSTKFSFNPSSGIVGTVGLTASGLAALTTAAESWVGPATTTGIYFKSGFAGFGTLNPGARVHIIGNLRLTESTLAQTANLSVSLGSVGWISAGDIPLVFGSSNVITLQLRSGGSNLQAEIKGQSGQTGNFFAITTNGGTTGDRLLVKLAGQIGLGGVTAPTAMLHLPAGTTAANTAPQKYTSGPLLTTAEAGAVEFLTDKFYGTITTGAARKTFAFLESPALVTPDIGAATGTSLSLSNTINLIATGGAPTVGQLTMVLGTKTVNTTAATATCRIFFQRVTTGGTIGFATTYTVVAGTSFTVSSDSALDTSVYNFWICEAH